MAWAGQSPVRAETAAGKPITLDTELKARDGSGDKIKTTIAAIGGSPTSGNCRGVNVLGDFAPSRRTAGRNCAPCPRLAGDRTARPVRTRRATPESLPREIADQLLAAIADTAIRPALIRPVGRHADRHRHTHTPTGLPRLEHPGPRGLGLGCDRGCPGTPHNRLRCLVARGPRNCVATGSPHNRPLLLVCTHSKRDLCCAMYGRPLAAGLASNPNYAQAVWETSHLGGHRFAPTAVQLPTAGFMGASITPQQQQSSTGP